MPQLFLRFNLSDIRSAAKERAWGQIPYAEEITGYVAGQVTTFKQLRKRIRRVVIEQERGKPVE